MQAQGRVSNGLDWQVRYTWECGPGITHPKFTYAAVASEDKAIDEGVAAIDRMAGKTDLRLVEVHRRHISSNRWVKVE